MITKPLFWVIWEGRCYGLDVYRNSNYSVDAVACNFSNVSGGQWQQLLCLLFECGSTWSFLTTPLIQLECDVRARTYMLSCKEQEKPPFWSTETRIQLFFFACLPSAFYDVIWTSARPKGNPTKTTSTVNRFSLFQKTWKLVGTGWEAVKSFMHWGRRLSLSSPRISWRFQLLWLPSLKGGVSLRGSLRTSLLSGPSIWLESVEMGNRLFSVWLDFWMCWRWLFYVGGSWVRKIVIQIIILMVFVGGLGLWLFRVTQSLLSGGNFDRNHKVCRAGSKIPFNQKSFVKQSIVAEMAVKWIDKGSPDDATLVRSLSLEE